MSLLAPGDIFPAREAIEKIPITDLGPPIEIPDIPEEKEDLDDEEVRFYMEGIKQEKKQKSALVLAHNYVKKRVQDTADYVGDSLHLARIGGDSDADVLVEASVLFMNHILAVMKKPGQTVLAPSLDALCSLAAHAKVDKILDWRRDHPTGKVISYVNTYLDIKAESDICCGSGNAEKVIMRMAEEFPDSPLLFLPDVYLGLYATTVLQSLGQSIDRLWLMMGACHVHEQITPDHVRRQRMLHPDAAVVAHRECGCVSECLTLLNRGLVSKSTMRVDSTWGMIDFAKKTPHKKIIVATTVTNIYPMSIAAPDKEFIPANPNARCAFMEQNTLKNLYEALRDMKHTITIDPELAKRALIPIKRMLSIR